MTPRAISHTEGALADKGGSGHWPTLGCVIETPADGGGPFGILFVCTGNICRSPIAEQLTAAALHTRLDRPTGDARRVRVASAGTSALVGHPIEPAAAQALHALGVTPAPFRAREITADLVAGADLVLTMTRQHRATVVTLLPRAARHTFTLREFARLTAGLTPPPATDPAQRGRALVRAAAGRRGTLPPAPKDDDDVPDPYRQPLPAFRTTAQLIAAALAGPLDLLTATAVPSPDPAGTR